MVPWFQKETPSPIEAAGEDEMTPATGASVVGLGMGNARLAPPRITERETAVSLLLSGHSVA